MKNLERIAQQIGQKLNVTLWTKNGNRLYINGYGYNTKKCKQSVYLDLDNFTVKCYTDCPSQPSQWCISQSNEVQENLASYARYARMIANSNLTAEQFEARKSAVAKVASAKYEAIRASRVEKVEVKKVVERLMVAEIGVGKKVAHNKFGIGTIIEEAAETVKVQFGEEVKSLLKQFAKLQIVEA